MYPSVISSTFGRQCTCTMREVIACLSVGSLIEMSAHGTLKRSKSVVDVSTEIIGSYFQVPNSLSYAFIFGMYWSKSSAITWFMVFCPSTREWVMVRFGSCIFSNSFVWLMSVTSYE